MQKWCSDFGCSERHIRFTQKTHGLSQKRQAIYFKIQGTYFKISALYFSSFQISDKQQLTKSLRFGLYVWFSEVWGNRCDFGTNAHAHLPFLLARTIGRRFHKNRGMHRHSATSREYLLSMTATRRLRSIAFITLSATFSFRSTMG